MDYVWLDFSILMGSSIDIQVLNEMNLTSKEKQWYIELQTYHESHYLLKEWERQQNVSKHELFLVIPKDEAYKRSTWMYMSVANELTLTLLKDGSFSCLLHECDAEEEGERAWARFQMCLKYGQDGNQWGFVRILIL